MKNKIFLTGFIFMTLYFISTNCYSQSSSNEQRLIGTWVNDGNGGITIFNSDGTGSDGGGTFKYAAVGNKLILYRENQGNSASAFEYFISNDGRTLIVTWTINGTTTGFFYRKRN